MDTEHSGPGRPKLADVVRRITVIVPDSLYARLAKEARARDRNRSEIVRDLLGTHLPE